MQTYIYTKKIKEKSKMKLTGERRGGANWSTNEEHRGTGH